MEFSWLPTHQLATGKKIKKYKRSLKKRTVKKCKKNLKEVVSIEEGSDESRQMARTFLRADRPAAFV